MKLCYLLHGRFPSERAHSTQIVKMCNALASHGVDVTLAVSDRATHIKETAEEYYGEPFHFAVQRVPVFDTVSRGSRWPRVFHRPLFFLEQLSYFWHLTGLRQFDVIYGREPTLLYLIGRRVGFDRVVYESHDANTSFFARRLLAQGVKTVVISEGIRDAYRALGVPDAQLLVAHDAIDESFFEPAEDPQAARKRLGITSDRPFAMYIGGFDAWKGVETFLAAAVHVPEVHFVAVGGSATAVTRFQEQYPQVQFLGSRPYRELRDNQQAADVLVVPNTAKNDLSAKYTSPLKVFAHLASGVPLVCTDIPSLRNAVPRDAAFWCASDDPSALAAAVRSALARPAEARTRTTRAREVAHAHTWSKRARAITEFISLRG